LGVLFLGRGLNSYFLVSIKALSTGKDRFFFAASFVFFVLAFVHMLFTTWAPFQDLQLLGDVLKVLNGIEGIRLILNLHHFEGDINFLENIPNLAGLSLLGFDATDTNLEFISAKLGQLKRLIVVPNGALSDAITVDGMSSLIALRYLSEVALIYCDFWTRSEDDGSPPQEKLYLIGFDGERSSTLRNLLVPDW
jgi:hypothetical protein